MAIESELTVPREIVDENRAALATVPRWITLEDRAAGRFEYGMPTRAYELMDLPMGGSPMIADLLVAIARARDSRRYLEIGVSAGKSFWLVARDMVARGGACVGFDFEAINPTLRSMLAGWGDAASYVEGDVFDPRAWDRLADRGPFDLVFSDALHDPAGLRAEHEHLRRLDLTAPGAVIVWDDLEQSGEGPMWSAVREIHAARGGVYTLTGVAINGWTGEHEPPHMVGVSRPR